MPLILRVITKRIPSLLENVFGFRLLFVFFGRPFCAEKLVGIFIHDAKISMRCTHRACQYNESVTRNCYSSSMLQSFWRQTHDNSQTKVLISIVGLLCIVSTCDDRDVGLIHGLSTIALYNSCNYVTHKQSCLTHIVSFVGDSLASIQLGR